MHQPISQMPGTVRPLLVLAWPVLVEQVLVMLVGFSDTLLAGHYLREDHLAAMTAMSYALWALTNLFAVVAIGATALIARFVGAGDYPLARRTLNQSFVLGALLAVVLTALGLIFGERLVALWQLEGESGVLAARYLRILLPMIPAMMLEQIGIAALRGAGDMVTGLVTMLLVNVVNIAVAWSLLLGVGPLPQLGWDSLAIGTAAGHLVGGLIPIAVLIRGRAGLGIERRQLVPDFTLMRRILRIGLPGGCDILTIVVCQMVYLSLVTGLGVVPSAAHGVAIRIESLAYLPGTAFQVAAATLAGQYLGAGNYRQASHSVWVACLLGLTLMSTAGLMMFFFADELVCLFVGPELPEVRSMAAPLLRIVSFAMPPLALLSILNGALRGAGDTRWPLLFSLFGFLVVRMPLAWYLCYVALWGVSGAWYAMAIDLTARCILVTARFFHGGWKHVRV